MTYLMQFLRIVWIEVWVISYEARNPFSYAIKTMSRDKFTQRVFVKIEVDSERSRSEITSSYKRSLFSVSR